MKPIRPRRSALYMPGSNARALEKARNLAADVLLLDLEDAVAPDVKADARDRVYEAVHDGGFGPREVVVRVNALETPWGAADLEAAAACRPAAVLVPKVSSPDDLARIGAHLDALGAPLSVAVWAMIETPASILDVARIAAAARDPLTRLTCFVMGTNDLAKETRARLLPGRAAMLPWLMQALAAARAEGLDILDGVFNALDDADGFAAECAQGRDLGFDGKTLIHPRQLEPANRLFAPDADEVAQARAVIAAFAKPENATLGAISLDGRMVERLHAETAARTVALAEAITARG